MIQDIEKFDAELKELLRKHGAVEAVCAVSFKTDKLYLNQWRCDSKPTTPYFNELNRMAKDVAVYVGGNILFDSRMNN